MIILYEKDETTFDSNGLCVLDPSSCIVTEVAGGEYELELEHPLDDHQKCTMMVEERLIKAPVPPTYVPQTTLPELIGWKAKVATDVYSKTPKATYANKNWKKIKEVKDNPLNYAYNPMKYYNSGSLALYGNNVYVASRASMWITPGTNGFIWENIGTLNDAQPTINHGSIIVHLAVGDVVYKIADSGDYMQVRTANGKLGYALTADLEQSVEREQETIQPFTITEQVFRIYETSCDEETNTYKVRAKHLSYDFMSNVLYECKVTEAEPVEAIAFVQGSLACEDLRKIACNISGTKISQDWSFKNPVSALLDPDSGLVPKLNARLVRNNNEFYILSNSTPKQGITIKYGVNMLGVNWTRSIENVVTRIIPRSGSSDKGFLFIDNGGRISGSTVQNQGKDYVESANADDYELTRIMVMNCSYAVDQEYEKPDGTKAKYTKADVLQKMLDDAKNKFVKEGIDGVDITLEVEFLLLGDTEEYKQYRGLQTVTLYDSVLVKTGKSRIDARAMVTEYEYDCLRKRYNSIKLGTVNSFNKRIAGYRFINGSITYDKLSPDLLSRIVSANASSTIDSGSASGTPTGGAVTILVPNTVSDDGIVTKGSGQASKVWKTDAQGNPAWRDEAAGITVVDNLNSTSGTDALSANMGHELDMKKADEKKLNGTNFSSVGSLSDMQTLIKNFVTDNMTDNSVCFVTASFSASFDPFGGASFGLRIYRSNGSYFSVLGTSYLSYTVLGTYNNGTWAWKQFDNYMLPLAASGTRGGVQIGYTQNDKNYPVQLDNEKMYVNVPWTDTQYSLPLAASGTRGGVKIGYTQSGKNYPVQLDNEKMYVNVPWTDHYAWSDITGKPSYYDGKAVKSITRNGTTFTATCLDGTTFTFTQQDNDHYAWSDITSKPATATRWPTWSEVTSKPTLQGAFGGWTTISDLAVNGTYTATGDGFIVITMSPSTSSLAYAYYSADGFDVRASSDNGTAQSITIPVKKGNVIKCTHKYNCSCAIRARYFG